MTNKKSQKVILQERDDSAPLFERIIFSRRPLLLAFFFFATLFFGYQAAQLRPEASFERMIPTYHEYIQNFLKHQDALKGLSNSVRISVETTQGDIFTAKYQEILKQIHDEVFFINGVDRQGLKSLWASSVRWIEVTEDGFAGGPVIPDDFDGSPAKLDQLRANVLRSGQIGTLVANDFKSSIILAPLYEKDPTTGQPLDYRKLSSDLEKLVREKYQSDTIKIHITGFAKVVGDLIDGATRVFLFFMIAFVVLLALLLFNSRCWRSTLVRAVTSIVGVIWQMGLLHLFGYGLNPYSMLVPFLMFALGVSHGIQMFNAMVHEMITGADKLTAARRAYRTVYMPGLSALFTDGIGFATLFVIAIGVIQDIAVGASLGVLVVAFSDLCLLPVLMSYSGISKKGIEQVRKIAEGHSQPIWSVLSKLTSRKPAMVVIAVSVILLGTSAYIRQDLKVGDLDPGAPELRPDSRYNQDNAFMINHYATSTDMLVVMVETPPGQCADYTTLNAMDRLEWEMMNTSGVQATRSLAGFMKLYLSGMNEGNLKWMTINRNSQLLGIASWKAPKDLITEECDINPLMVYLTDHKAETLERVVGVVEGFAEANDTKEVRFLLGAGNAGIEAATNVEVKKAHLLMTVLVYVVVFGVCLLTFRSVRAAICVVVPLYITSVLCEALMTMMGIGIKVATLPVIAVGVGIGVDYGIYIFNKLKFYLDQGDDLHTAYFRTLITTGRAVAFTGITLGIGVATWAFSPIKFQADMGILLTFMFVWNMVGALVLLPALAHFLLKVKPATETDKAVR